MMSNITHNSYMLSHEYQVAGSWYLLFPSEDHLCANWHMQEQLMNMMSQCQNTCVHMMSQFNHDDITMISQKILYFATMAKWVIFGCFYRICGFQDIKQCSRNKIMYGLAWIMILSLVRWYNKGFHTLSLLKIIIKSPHKKSLLMLTHRLFIYLNSSEIWVKMQKFSNTF